MRLYWQVNRTLVYNRAGSARKERGGKVTNRYGVDVAYFKKELAALSRSLDDRTPDELARYFMALHNVAVPVGRPLKNAKTRRGNKKSDARS